MDPLMKHLFDALETTRQPEAQTQAVQATSAAFQAAEQRLTYDEFEEMWNAVIEISCATQLDSFTLGFRLGVQLTLEGLRPVYPAGEAAAPADGPYPPR